MSIFSDIKVIENTLASSDRDSRFNVSFKVKVDEEVLQGRLRLYSTRSEQTRMTTDEFIEIIFGEHPDIIREDIYVSYVSGVGEARTDIVRM